MKLKFKNLKGPLVEIAGPTKDGYEIIDLGKSERKVFTSNIFSGDPIFDTNGIKDFWGKVDFQCRAEKLPFKDGIIGVIFCSKLGGAHFKNKKNQKKLKKYKFRSVEYYREMSRQTKELRRLAIIEMLRVLLPGGFAVLKQFNKDDTRFARRNGFNLIYQKKIRYNRYYIFKKKK